MRKTESFLDMDDLPCVSADEQDLLIDDGASDMYSSPPSSPPARRDSSQGSFTQSPAWPKSYRRSMDMYIHLGSPGTSASASLAGSADLSSFYRKQTRSTEKLNSLSALFLPTKEENEVSANEKVSTEPQKISFYESVEYGQGLGGKCSATQGTLNGINVICGVGILSTPYAVKEGGWLSLIMFLAIAVISLYTGVLLRRCLESQTGLETYPDIGQAAFGMTGRIIISIFLYMELYAACVEYLILEGDNISAVFPNANVSLYGLKLTASELFTITTAICVLPTVWLRDLSLLSYVSAVGVVASVVLVVCVLWSGVADGVGFHRSGPLLKLSTFPVSIGLYGYCFSGHCVFPNIYSSLQKPSQFTKVMTVSFVICAILYGGTAVMGFTMFGDETQSQITLNLPEQFVSSKIAIWATIINPFTKYALAMTPIALSLEELLPSFDITMKNYGFSLGIQTLLVLSTLCVALLLPFFDYVMAFVGSFLSMFLCIIFPASCFLKLSGNKTSLLQKSCCVFVIIFAIVCCITGTYSAVAGIIKSL